MRGMQWALVALVAFGCGGGAKGDKSGSNPYSANRSDADLRFKSVFWATVTEEGETGVEPIRDRVTLDGGTELGWIVEAPAGLHLYVFQQTDDGKVRSFRPAGAGPMRTILPRGARLDDNPGLERFYLIASRKPLERLDALIPELERTDNDAASSVLADEIASLRRRYEKRDREASRPARFAGSVRGNNPADYAIWYEADKVGVWTFTIEHR